MANTDQPAIIVGGGIAGLACARRPHARAIPVRLLEVGGRIKTDRYQGYRLDRGFQVLQTAYPEARRMLDDDRLDLRSFASGAKIRIRGRFYTVADPFRHPGGLKDTLTPPSAAFATGSVWRDWPGGSPARPFISFLPARNRPPWIY